MPLEMTLKQLFLNGEVDQTGGSRVEYYGDRTVVPTTAKAAAMLEAVTEWFEDMAEEQKSITGLEALALGAYELVSKVSLVLAVPGGIRTEEHVRWSFALIKRDIEEKTRLVVSNDRAKDYLGRSTGSCRGDSRVFQGYNGLCYHCSFDF